MKDTIFVEKVLKEELSKHFEGQSQRLQMMSKLLIAMIKMGSISFSKLSLVLNPLVKKSSNFRRIQRFVKEYTFSRSHFIQLMWSLFGANQSWIALTIDRTNWKFGKTNINILMIGISYQGTAIPLIWMLLNKRGNSSQKERIELLDSLLFHLNQKQITQIRCLLADREFIGYQWIKHLKKQPFTFFIRIKKNALVRKNKSANAVYAMKLFRQNNFQALRKSRHFYGHQLYIGGRKINAKEWLILISTTSLSQGPMYYGERWGIEVFFGATKSRGFNFEDTHVTDLDRLSNLGYLISIAFSWSLKTGNKMIEKGYQIPIKQLKSRKTKLFSIFRIGLDYLRERFLNFLASFEDILILSCT